MVEDSFESLRGSGACLAQGQEQRYEGRASLQILGSRFDDAIRNVWMSVAARRKAVWEAWAAASTSGRNNYFTSDGTTLDNADT
jgi:hypothetical protein